MAVTVEEVYVDFDGLLPPIGLVRQLSARAPR